MKYGKLGSTGLDVSRICLGCMSYGHPDQGTHPWSLDEDSSRPFIRRAIEAKPITFENLTIPVTASIGVAVFEPGGPFRQVPQLIKAADLAVYNAKHSGRNCVKVFSMTAPAPALKGVTDPAAA